MRIELHQSLDGNGEPECFSGDLWPLVESTRSDHLDENGLPMIGTLIRKGMPVIGKVGKSAKYDPLLKPNSLQIHGMEFDELKSQFGFLWYDASFYANAEHEGVVTRAELLGESPHQTAIVEIDTTAEAQRSARATNG
jgi:DNA-directed RNA polymerase beta subunit